MRYTWGSREVALAKADPPSVEREAVKVLRAAWPYRHTNVLAMIRVQSNVRYLRARRMP